MSALILFWVSNPQLERIDTEKIQKFFQCMFVIVCAHIFVWLRCKFISSTLTVNIIKMKDRCFPTVSSSKCVSLCENEAKVSSIMTDLVQLYDQFKMICDTKMFNGKPQQSKLMHMYLQNQLFSVRRRSVWVYVFDHSILCACIFKCILIAQPTCRLEISQHHQCFAYTYFALKQPNKTS